MNFIVKRSVFDYLMKAIVILSVLLSIGSAWSDPIITNSSSLSDRLLSLFRDGLFHSNPDEKSNSARSDSLKKVLELLSNKVDNQNKKFSISAMQEFNAMTSETAKAPKPINLNEDDPAKAVIKYFQEMSITDETCQQRTICELLTEPQASYGVFGELINYVFGREEEDENMKKWINEESYNKMYKAAQDGRRMNDCASIYSKCSNSYKDYIKLVSV